MKKSDITQALAEQAGEELSIALHQEHRVRELKTNRLDGGQGTFISHHRESAGINLAAINHINGVSPTQE